MKANELKDLSAKEIVEKIDSLETELFDMRFQAKLGTVSNPVRMRFIKKDIARAKTVLNSK